MRRVLIPSSHRYGKIIRVDPIRDPLLIPVDDKVPVAWVFRGAGQIRDVRPSPRLGDAQTNNLRPKIDEAIRLGFKNILIPKTKIEIKENFQNLINIKEISNINEAMNYVLKE